MTFNAQGSHYVRSIRLRPYALNVRTNISSYRPRTRSIRLYYVAQHPLTMYKNRCNISLLGLHGVTGRLRSYSNLFVGSMEAPSKSFPLFFLLPDWLKLNHLKSRMECGFSDNFSRHICSTVAETIGMTNYAASFGAKKCSENHI